MSIIYADRVQTTEYNTSYEIDYTSEKEDDKKVDIIDPNEPRTEDEETSLSVVVIII